MENSQENRYLKLPRSLSFRVSYAVYIPFIWPERESSLKCYTNEPRHTIGNNIYNFMPPKQKHVHQVADNSIVSFSFFVPHIRNRNV